ncbi:MAG: hypothetical protein SVT56_11770 [Chloroflexota bacterium]|nr:hypothetical protein [Chloroflexota bacterium]
MERSYKSLKYEKEAESLKNLTSEEAALKAIIDAGIPVGGEAPEVVYKLVLDRLKKSESMMD